MLIPIDLHDETAFQTDKIDDERSNGMLTAKLSTIQSSCAKLKP